MMAPRPRAEELASAEDLFRKLVVRIRELRGEKKDWGPVGIKVERRKVILVRLEREPEEDEMGEGWFGEYEDPTT